MNNFNTLNNFNPVNNTVVNFPTTNDPVVNTFNTTAQNNILDFQLNREVGASIKFTTAKTYDSPLSAIIVGDKLNSINFNISLGRDTVANLLSTFLFDLEGRHDLIIFENDSSVQILYEVVEGLDNYLILINNTCVFSYYDIIDTEIGQGGWKNLTDDGDYIFEEEQLVTSMYPLNKFNLDIWNGTLIRKSTVLNYGALLQLFSKAGDILSETELDLSELEGKGLQYVKLIPDGINKYQLEFTLIDGSKVYCSLAAIYSSMATINTSSLINGGRNIVLPSLGTSITYTYKE